MISLQWVPRLERGVVQAENTFLDLTSLSYARWETYIF